MLPHAASAPLTHERACSFSIKPESTTPQLDTKDWPLLLKNYDKLLVRSQYPTHTSCREPRH